HGAVGEVTLGSTMLTDANLADHAAALAEIGAALGSGGTLQLFGCDVGQGAAGQQFVNDLSSFAGGINVAAATHDVGSAAMGGSWTLDARPAPDAAASLPVSVNGQPISSVADPSQVNSAGSPVPFTEQALNNFQGVLANPVQTQLWITASGGGQVTELIHVDDNGGTSSVNNTALWNPTSAQPPTPGSQIIPRALDPTNQTYFIVQTNAGIIGGVNSGNGIYKGSLGQELSNPSGTPSLTSIFFQTGAVNTTGGITGIALDTDNQQVYFTNRHSILKVGYTGGTVTTPATGGNNVFADGLALDLPHNQAFFFSNTTFTTFTPTHNSQITTSISSNAIYVDSNLSS